MKLPLEWKVENHIAMLSLSHTVGLKSNGMYHINLIMNGREIPSIIDSGVECSAISLKLVKELNLKVEPSERIITGIAGIPINTYGQISVPIQIDNKTYQLQAEVLGIEQPLILGLSFLNAHNTLIDFKENTITFKIIVDQK